MCHYRACRGLIGRQEYFAMVRGDHSGFILCSLMIPIGWQSSGCMTDMLLRYFFNPNLEAST
ncbi:hypothetical protein [Novipirellula galeiformis]|uniref:hypothetical protein n=1 Tax=Novipirellula galeiformis TaxID=2528004 RepID=UPI0011B70AE9|nr:hypothetical protein [Novipirellula galeiformis]